MAHVLVAGGGIAGLSAARALAQQGHSITLVEAETRYGGKLLTEQIDGLLIDAGPDSFLSSKPAALTLIDELGLAERVVNTRADGGGTYILAGGRLHPLPEGVTLLVPADVRSIARTSLLSFTGKARMLLDYVIPALRDDRDETVGAFVRRRVGRQAFERLADPLLSGIYAGNADELSLLATFPRFREVERTHGGLIRGALAQRKQSTAPATSTSRRTPFVSLAGGLGELIDALVTSLASHDLRLGTRAARLSMSDTGFVTELSDGTSVSSDGVVLALPAFAAAGLVAPLAPELAGELSDIPYVSTATVSLAYAEADVACRQQGRGFVVPRTERRAITAMTWTSNKFAGRAPEGVALLRAFVGRSGDEAPAFLPDDVLIERVRGELGDILGISAEPRLARVYRWPNALPQYVLGHVERLARIAALERRLPGLVLTGSAYRGVGIADVIRDAQGRAQELNNALARSTVATPSAVP